MHSKILALAAFVCSAVAAPSQAINVNDKVARWAAAAAGPCEGAGNVCYDVASHYDGGLGACGTNVDTNTEYAIALPHGLMGPQSNDNPYCGRGVTITVAGKTVNAKVVDKCMGCEGYKIDMTNKLFTEFAALDVGIIQGVSWYFT